MTVQTALLLAEVLSSAGNIESTLSQLKAVTDITVDMINQGQIKSVDTH